jgi:molybdopterin synthase sulfur carrier subunit
VKSDKAKSITVRYFALLREKAGKETEVLDVSCATYGDLYCELSTRYNFALPIEMIQVAVDDEFAQLDMPIRNGANVVFIPPVAGG